MSDGSILVQPKIKVKTRLPMHPSLPPNSQRKPIITERLIIRGFEQEDLDGIHALRSQPEVMIYTSVGRPDANKAETQEFMNKFLPPMDGHTYDMVICWRETGEVIATGGMHKQSLWFGWPEVGYMFKKEYWGHGLATEFLKAWLESWWALPRSEVEIEVIRESVEGYLKGKGDGEVNENGEVIEVPELLTAMVEETTPGSQRVLEKSGFRQFMRWTEPDNRAGFEARPVVLDGFVIDFPKK